MFCSSYNVFSSLAGFKEKVIETIHKIRSEAIGIALAYVLSELSPFVPSIDLQVIKDSLKPLLILPSFSIVLEVFIHVVIWLVVIRLLSFQQEKTPIKVVIGIWLYMLAAKVVIVLNVKVLI